MAIGHRIDATRRLAVIRLTGRLTSGAILEFAKGFRKNPSFSADVRQLVLLDLEGADVNTTDWLAYHDSNVQEPHGRQVAIVAGRTFEYAVARQFQQAYEHQGQQIHVFRQLEEALAWLGVSREEFDASEAEAAASPA